MAKTATNLSMDQGSDWSVLVVWNNPDGTPKNLTGYSARMQLRSSYAANTAAESLTTSTGEIHIEPLTGKITFGLPASRTSSLKVDYTSQQKPPRTPYVYDLEMIDSTGSVEKILFGSVTVYAEVTR